ncbi:pyrimidine reductase family protein [Microbacterium sp. A93]|uniref:pyrimidine reductase family protein n=1 Tax=unclassified Microbacterium TaxID=2609290 RepID=UPI003F42AA8E
MSTRIDRLWPQPAEQLDDDGILATYQLPDGPWLRMNFVSSVDGAATRDGRSGGLGGAADRRVFELLRRQADVVLVGAGTVRTEGYGAMRLQDDAVTWRMDRGLPAHPTFALVSGRLDLDPESDVFTGAPTRPIVYTVGTASDSRREALSAVADIVDAGSETLDPRKVREDLEARGLLHIHSEGGPSLFGSFISAGAVDEVCVTIAAELDAGDASRIAHSKHAAPTAMSMAALLKGGEELLLRYTRR